ncbi:unnamed protein product, partial [Rotaria sp. Silwood2]
SSRASSQTVSLQRTSIDSSGSLGSLYDINQDHVRLERININNDQRLSQSYRTGQCHNLTFLWVTF